MPVPLEFSRYLSDIIPQLPNYSNTHLSQSALYKLLHLLKKNVYMSELINQIHSI